MDSKRKRERKKKQRGYPKLRLQAAFSTGVPGPKIAATPALYK
jgi:hypothetical protein